MRTHLLGEEEAVAEAVEGEWEGVEVHVGMDTWSMLMVDGKMSMLLPMQAMGMLTMVQLMRVMGMRVVEAAVSGAVAGEVAMVVSLVAMVVSLIISMMEGIMMRHQRHPEVGGVVSGGVAGEVAMVVASLIISKTEVITRRPLFLHQLEVVVEAVAVGEAAQLGAEGAVAMPMATWCMPPLRAHKQSSARCCC